MLNLVLRSLVWRKELAGLVFLRQIRRLDINHLPVQLGDSRHGRAFERRYLKSMLVDF